MAVIQLGSLASAIKGKIGGVVFQTSPSGQIAKIRQFRGTRRTDATRRQADVLFTCIRQWKSFSNATRNAFTAAAPDFPTVDRFGNGRISTGYGLFMRTCLGLTSTRVRLVLAPPVPDATGAIWSVVNANTPANIRFTRTRLAGSATVSVYYYLTGPLSTSTTVAPKRFRLVSVFNGITGTGTDNITAAYTNIYGANLAGSRIFWKAEVRINLSPQVVGFASGFFDV